MVHCERSDDVLRIVSISLDTQAIESFKDLGEEIGVPYQSLINMYLMESAICKKPPSFRKAS